MTPVTDEASIMLGALTHRSTAVIRPAIVLVGTPGSGLVVCVPSIQCFDADWLVSKNESAAEVLSWIRWRRAHENPLNPIGSAAETAV